MADANSPLEIVEVPSRHVRNRQVLPFGMITLLGAVFGLASSSWRSVDLAQTASEPDNHATSTSARLSEVGRLLRR